jgi:nicotinamide phosphoribosyltransferase
MLQNPLFAIDFYKVDHRRQYPEGTTEIYSNFTPRSVIHNHNLLSDFDNKVVVFGIQHFLIDFLYSRFKFGFFNKPVKEVIEAYKDMVMTALGLEDFDCSHIEALHNLGYLPICIKALPEGSRCPIGVPVLTIVNTLPEFFWLTNYLETIISASLWKPMTVATIAFEFKRLLTQYARKTGADESFIPYQIHDFSFRGMSGWDDASICGAAHLALFQGTDSISAIDLANRMYFAAETVSCVGSSVPATEHSVMCCNGIDGEYATIKRLITEVYPEGIVSIVADSYNFWEVLDVILPSLYKEIMSRSGKVVIRPDSGNPVGIICGDFFAAEGTPANRGALRMLWDTFGGSINPEGYKVLSPRIGLIYGDSITVDRARLILQIMEEMKFASSNIVFGVGSFSYQYVTRDTFGFAMKATSAVINGERRTIFKNPKTDNGKKKSAKGLLMVGLDLETGSYTLSEDVSAYTEKDGFLQIVYNNGIMENCTDLCEIRHNLDAELEDKLGI